MTIEKIVNILSRYSNLLGYQLLGEDNFEIVAKEIINLDKQKTKMKEFKFEIVLTDKDLEGDEYWEDALKKDGTGVATLTDSIEWMLYESNLLPSLSIDEMKHFVKLKSYQEK